MLLRSIAAATLIVSLGGCVQRDYLVANPSDGGAPASEMRYTSNLSYVANVEVIPLRIDPAFGRTSGGRSSARSRSGTTP